VGVANSGDSYGDEEARVATSRWELSRGFLEGTNMMG